MKNEGLWIGGGILAAIYLCKRGILPIPFLCFTPGGIKSPDQFDPSGTFGYWIFGGGGSVKEVVGRSVALSAGNALNVVPNPPFQKLPPVTPYNYPANTSIGVVEKTYIKEEWKDLPAWTGGNPYRQQYLLIRLPDGSKNWILKTSATIVLPG